MTTPAACPACYAPLAPEAKYCHRCGRAVTAGGRAEQMPWLFAWLVVGACIAGIAYFVTHKPAEQAGPDMANAGSAGAGDAPAGGAGQPPDISQMSPRERFLRLNDRIMSAASQGDTATVLRFSPMALTAYTMLDTVDADLRFHAAELFIQLGQDRAGLALADTIQAGAKNHLFADVVRAEVAARQKDTAAYDRSRRNFLAHYDAEIASKRPEYEEHKALLEEFKAQTTPK
jgi:hypothetical protein